MDADDAVANLFQSALPEREKPTDARIFQIDHRGIAIFLLQNLNGAGLKFVEAGGIEPTFLQWLPVVPTGSGCL